MLPGDYIAYKMSGQISTTLTGLSEGTLWDFKNNSPAYWLMNHYELDRGLIPDVVENFTNQGQVHQAAAELSGLQVGTPIYYRAGDQPNNAMSLNVLKPGDVAATGGTSGVIYALTDQITTQEHERLNHFAHVNYTNDCPIIGKLLCINGSGVMYRWLKDTTSLLTYTDMNQLAEQQAVGSNGLSVMPFGNGAERMLSNRVVGAHFLNLKLNVHDKSSLCRATLEGIAFSFAYGLELLKADNAQVGVIKTGNDNLFQSQIFSETIATIIGHEIELYETTGAVGAARAASLVEGGYHSLFEVMSRNVKLKNFTPNKDSEPYMKAYYAWKKELKFLLNNNQNP